jgi:hypothetical protein
MKGSVLKGIIKTFCLLNLKRKIMYSIRRM